MYQITSNLVHNTELIKVSLTRSAKKAIKGAIGSDGKPITPDHPEYLILH